MRLNFLTSVRVDVKVRLTMNDARNMFKNNYMESEWLVFLNDAESVY